MQINGFSNLYNNGTLPSLSAAAAESSASSKQIDSAAAPLSLQGDSGRRVFAANSAGSVSSEKAEQGAELRLLRDLAARDREVRLHEMAHQAVGGQHTGAVTYTFQRGPDGVMYAVGGEVSIDTSPVPGDPKATLEKAQIIERAAMAPANPSPQDLRVAAAARAMAVEAKAEIARTERSENDEEASSIAEEEATNSVEDSSLSADMSVDSQRRLEMASATESADTSEERREELMEELKEQRERSAEKLREFVKELAEIQARFYELNRRLIETGAVTSSVTVGNLLDRQA